jgi:hypothetical protein
MKSFYVPYKGKRPAFLDINGHRVVILAADQEAFEGDKVGEFVKADSVKAVAGGDSEGERQSALLKIARTSKSGVIVAPDDMDIGDLIKDLKEQLPWVQ